MPCHIHLMWAESFAVNQLASSAQIEKVKYTVVSIKLRRPAFKLDSLWYLARFQRTDWHFFRNNQFLLFGVRRRTDPSASYNVGGGLAACCGRRRGRCDFLAVEEFVRGIAIPLGIKLTAGCIVGGDWQLPSSFRGIATALGIKLIAFGLREALAR